MSSVTIHGHLPLLSSLLDPTFGIPPDVTFQIMGVADHQYVGGQVKETLLGEVKAHKMLLGLFSPVFKNEFFGPAKEATDVIPVKQTSLDSFERMVNYIYNKAIKWGDLSVLELYDVVNLAEKYQIPGLLDVVKTQMENIHLTMEDVVEVADTAAQFNQFPTISSSLLQSCAKFLKTNLKTDGDLLQFSISHSGSGQEATVLHLLALAKNMPGNPSCSNCKEEDCKDKLPVTDLGKLSPGCRITLNTTNSINFWFGKAAVVVSVDQLRNMVGVISPISGKGEVHFMVIGGQIHQFCYMCTST